MKAFLFSIAVVCLVLVPAGSSLHAEWVENGIGLGDAILDQTYQSIIPDGDGGCYIAWTDWRSGTGLVYVQRLDSYGDELWAPGGVRACLHNTYQTRPVMVSDGGGNIIVVWMDTRPSWKMYAQKMSSDGILLWDTEGELISTYFVPVLGIEICSDGAGGAILVWEDNRNGNIDIYAQRILSDGRYAWDVEDEPIDTDTYSDRKPAIISDGIGGAIITWQNGTGARIMAQRLSATGSPQWAAGGEEACGHLNYCGFPKIVSDGAGGAIIAWDDSRGADYDIYAQRVKHDGAMLWTADGEVICSSTGDQYMNDIASDGDWGAVIVWEDSRNSSLSADIYAQAIDGWGDIQWASNGIVMYTGSGEQSSARIVSNGDGGYFLAWLDMRSGVDYDIFSKKINQSGLSLWSSLSGTVCTSNYTQSQQTIIHDGEGNLLVAWLDERNGSDKDIYAQRIDRNGYWGNPAPSIASVRDIPGDQGGWVNISFDASRLDIWPEDEISSYTVWRAIDEQQAMLMMKSGVPLLSSASEMGSDMQGALRSQIIDGEIYYWTQVGLVTALDYFDEYSDQVQTLFDSTAVSIEYHYFQVIAHGSGPDAFWASAPDSGRSVDNLAPCPPLALAGEQAFDPEGLQLTWSANIEEDMDHYVIHRGTSENFLPGRFTLLAEQCDTLLFDDEWDWLAGYWYKIAAVDIHNNTSGYAVFGPDMVTGDDPMPAPDATFLEQNYPNPFNPNTTIAFGLKESGHVSLRIYDAAGRLVTTLVDESRSAGRYTTEWKGKSADGSTTASGVYFYRLITKEFEETKKMILLR